MTIESIYLSNRPKQAWEWDYRLSSRYQVIFFRRNFIKFSEKFISYEPLKSSIGQLCPGLATTFGAGSFCSLRPRPSGGVIISLIAFDAPAVTAGGNCLQMNFAKAQAQQVKLALFVFNEVEHAPGRPNFRLLYEATVVLDDPLESIMLGSG